MNTMQRARGFTLIEMIAAVAVVSIALGAIIAGMGRFAGNAAHLRERTIALIVAHNALAELDMQRAWPDVGERKGETEMAGAVWAWTITVQKTEDPQLRRADIVVQTPRSKNKDQAAKLSAFLAGSGRQ